MRPVRSFPVLALVLMSVAGCSADDTADSTPVTDTVTQDDASHCDSLESIEPGQYQQSHILEGVEQAYWVVVPEGYSTNAAADLYIVVPGGSGGAQAAVTAWGPGLTGLDAVVVFPEVATEETKTVPMIRALIDDVANQYCIDSSRIYATGGSSAAGFTARLMAEASDVIAAFAQGIGRFGTIGLEPIGPVPFIAWSGDFDRGQVEDSVAEWIESNGCTNVPVVSDLGSGVAHHHYESCDAPSEYYYFEGMGHQVPVHDCSGIQYCAEYEEFDFWDDVGSFFDANPLSTS